MHIQNDSKLLSICIPTYNGDKYIQNNIDIIVSQILQYNLCDIEIVVSDNCSNDKTEHIMRDYVNKYPAIIRYFRNDKNIGYDKNVIKLCSIAKGKYIHLFGDDDYYAPSGLRRLCDVLHKYQNLSILVLSNFYMRNDNYDEIVSRKNLNNKYTVKDKLYLDDSDNFVMDIEDRAWPNTNLVFRKEYFNNISNLEMFYNKDWIHLYILLYLAKKYPRCYVFADKYPIVINRVGVQKWLNNSDGPRIYFNNLWTYSFADKLGYNPKVFDWYRKKLLSEYITNITYRRSNNLFINIGYILKYIKYWYDIPMFYFKFIPKYLDVLKFIFSVRNERLAIGNNVKKVITLLGFRIKLKKKSFIPKFVHKFREGEILFLTNEKGNYKKVVTGSVFIEMLETLEYLNKSSLVDKVFLENLRSLSRKKYVPYSKYLKICYEYTKVIVGIDRSKIKTATGKLRQYQLELADYCYDKLSELERATGVRPILFYGNLLGAKIHHGFIPWDEDVDFVLSREDYKKAVDYFTSKYESVNCDEWTWQNYWQKYVEMFKGRENIDFCFNMPNCFKLINGTIRNYKIIDIFSLDNFPNNFKTVDFVNYKNKIVQTRNSTTKYFKEMFEYSKNLIENDKTLSPNSNKFYYGIDSFAFQCWPYSKFFYKNEIYPVRQVIFEGKKFWAPNNIDKCLKKIYGDYKNLPMVIETKHFDEYAKISDEMMADLRE